MELGLVGLGKMGGNMRTRLRDAGHTVVGLDHDLDISDVKSLAELVEALPSPKVVWVMVPAGGPTHEVITELGDLLGEGDLVVDGGNSRWTDDIAHGEMLAAKNIGFVDCGVSGGVWGLQNGYALMYGGEADAIAKVQEAFDPQARRRVRVRARRQGRCRALLEDGPQRHRVRHHAELRRGLGAAREGRRRRQRHRGLPLVA